MSGPDNKVVLKVTSGMLGGLSGSLLLLAGICGMALGGFTQGCGSWMIEGDTLGTFTIIGELVRFGGTTILASGAIVALFGVGLLLWLLKRAKPTEPGPGPQP